MRRARIALVLIAPALVLIGWLIAAQLPRWTAPQANWFPPNTPGVCAAVNSLVLYHAQRADLEGIGSDAAPFDAIRVVAAHYPVNLLLRDYAVLTVQATLPGDQRRGYYVVTVLLNNDPLNKVAIVYLDAQTGDVKALITAIDDPARNCDLDVKAALLAAAKSAPLILLVIYGGVVAAALVARLLLRRRGAH